MDRQKDGPIDVAKLVVTFRSSANAPKGYEFILRDTAYTLSSQITHDIPN